jgi:urea transport system permease protein
MLQGRFMRFFISFLVLLFMSIAALAQDIGALVDALGKGTFKDREAAIAALAASGNEATMPVLEALTVGNLHVRKSDQKVFITAPKGDLIALTDPAGMKAAGEAPKAEFERIKVNNAVRRAIQSATGGLTLFSEDAAVRRKAALSVLKSGDPSILAALQKAIAAEKDTGLADLMKQAAAAATLKSSLGESEKLAAINLLNNRSDRDTSALLAAFASTVEGPLKSAGLSFAQSI